jgi:succinate dehydrogenase / fumarate reductase flavoprotein subunit
MEGAVPPGEYGGWGLPLAEVSGMIAAKSIARMVPEMPQAKIDKEQQESLKERVFAPMKGKKKEFGHFDAFHRIQQAFIPYKYCFIRTEKRLKESLAMLEEIQREVLPKVKVQNPHELLKYHEAAGMASSAEITQRAALYRTETRGGHIREDYPEKDDKNWLKWTAVREEDGKMALSTKPVPKVT